MSPFNLSIDMYCQQWADFEEFWQKYGSLTNPDAYARFVFIGEVYNEGMLAEQNALDPNLFYRHNGRILIGLWDKIELIVKELRTRHKRLSKMWMPLEHLVNEFKQMDQRELSTVS